MRLIYLFRAFLGPAAQQQINTTLLGNGLGSVEQLTSLPGIDVPSLRDVTYAVKSDALWFALIAIAALMLVCLVIAIASVCYSWCRSVHSRVVAIATIYDSLVDTN